MGGRGRRGFPLFWLGQAASQLGDEITLLALPWLVAETTASPLAVGALEAFSFVPVLFFGLIIGVIADRRSRRRSMIDADLARLFLLGSIPVAAWIGSTTVLAHVLLIAFLAGTARILFEATSQSFVPDLVGESELVRANARLSVTEGVAIVLGPTAAGLLITGLGSADAVAVDALTFLVSFAAIMLLVPVVERREDASVNVGHDIRTGLRAIWEESFVRLSTLVNALANVASGMTVALLVIYLQRTLMFTGVEAGIVIGANGVGVLLAGRLSGISSSRLGLGRTIIGGHVLAAAGVLVLAGAHGPFRMFGAGLGLGLIGLGVVLTIVSTVSLRQLLVAGPVLGRVTASYRTFLHGAMAAGALIGGVIGEFIGVREGLICAGVFYVAVAVCAFFTSLNGPDPVALESVG